MILQVEFNLVFLPQPNEVQLLRTDVLPPRGLITSALGLFFLGDALLMSNLVSRGWDIPGGHIEPGETPEATVRRETREEAAVELGEIRLFAVQRIEISAPCPAGYRYPYPVSYQVFYCGPAARVDAFIPSEEVSERGFFAPDAARKLAWVQNHPEMYGAAVEVMGRHRA